jgi:predicted thioesterase
VIDTPQSASSTSLHFAVGPDDTAIALGSGDLPVLATPRLIAWCESACVAVLQLTGDKTSVGTRVEVEHVGAASLESRIRVTATTSYQEGRLIRFDVVAEAFTDLNPAPVRLLHGTMTRVIVDRERFMARLQSR